MWYSAVGCIVTLILSLLELPLAAEAQRAGKVARVGLLLDESPALSTGSSSETTAETLSKALHDLGWVEGQNLTFERRYAARKNEFLPGLAADLVRFQVDTIVTIGTPATRAAKHATETIPIVFARVADPVGFGLVRSIAQPGGNVTGVSIVIIDLAPKRLELLREAMPGLARVGALWDPSQLTAAPELQQIEAAARSLGVEMQPVGVQRPEEFEGALEALTQQRAEALIVVSGVLFTEHRHQLAALATTARLPMMAYRREFVEAGGLMAYGPNLRAIYRRGAIYVDKILKGAKPADLPVEQPMTFELAINLKTAEALGLTIPPVVLFQADEVIK
jgi:putative ABC transport system substrate-binding protein